MRLKKMIPAGVLSIALTLSGCDWWSNPPQPTPPPPRLSLSCGKIQVYGRAVAIPNTRDIPIADQVFDKDLDVPSGEQNHYGNPTNTTILSPGFPNNGAAHSWISLSTKCVIPDDRRTMSIRANITSDLDSGNGAGSGSSAEARFTWASNVELPVRHDHKAWAVTIKGANRVVGPNPQCNFRVNGDVRNVPSNGDASVTFNDVSGKSELSVSCAHGTSDAWPNGGKNSLASPSATSFVTISFDPD